MYLKLQETVNYCSWRQNMILLFKRKQTYKIALELKSKSAELTFLMKLMKLQYKDRLTAAHAVSFAGSMMMTSQSRESTVTEASALSPVILVLFWDDIENDYQFYNWEWELHDKWIKLNYKTYDIIWQHTEESCQSFLDDRISFKTWSVIENLYQVIILVLIVEIYSKIHDQ